MNNRNITNFIRFILDNLIPPILRDSKWFMWIPFKIIFKGKAQIFFDFKSNLHQLSDKEIETIYKDTAAVHIDRKTDLNDQCLHRIVNTVKNKTVLEVGCGNGYLTNMLESKNKMTALDFVEQPSFKPINEQTVFKVSNASSIPFNDNQFDVVVCTHTLEHVRDINTSLNELRRVAKEKVIIVVPKQRPYKYTFDLHIHFFPYEYSFMQLVGRSPKFTKQCIETLKGDIYYEEQAYNK